MTLIAPNACDKLDSLVPQQQLEEYASKRDALPLQWSFSVVPGFFKQSAIDTDDGSYDALKDHFGLAKESWNGLIEELRSLNESADDNTQYKLVFCARHGQGHHNKAVEIFGLDAWNDHYSHLGSATLPNGETIVFGPDPFLTSLGEQQAQFMNDAFKREISEFGCPLPSKLFCSPFTRSAQTLSITMNGITISKDGTDAKVLAGKPLSPLVTENLRETIGSHLCDKRSTKSIFQKRLSGWGFQFEDGFSEEDVLYRDDWREPISDQAIRANKFLQFLFSTEEYKDDQIVYNASHAGEIKALLIATGHRQYTVPTAGMIPLLVKATRND